MVSNVVMTKMIVMNASVHPVSGDDHVQFDMLDHGHMIM